MFFFLARSPSESQDVLAILFIVWSDAVCTLRTVTLSLSFPNFDFIIISICVCLWVVFCIRQKGFDWQAFKETACNTMDRRNHGLYTITNFFFYFIFSMWEYECESACLDRVKEKCGFFASIFLWVFWMAVHFHNERQQWIFSKKIRLIGA